MRFVPVPTTIAHIEGSRRHWEPFLDKISKRSKESIDVLLEKIYAGVLQLGLVWDDEQKKAMAVLGMQYRKEGDELICEIVHLTGRGLKDWGHQLPELHEYLKEHVRCARVRTYCRRGLEPLLTDKSYKKTHVIMEHCL